MEMTYFLTTRKNDWLSVVVTSAWSKESFITKAMMEYSDVAYAKMRRKRFCAKLTVVLQEDTMQAMLRFEKYGKRAYGGQLRKRMYMNIVDNATYVNSWGSPRRSHGYHIN